MLEIHIIDGVDENLTHPLYQYDVGQKIKITGTNLTIPPNVHFAKATLPEALVVPSEMVDDAIVASIPNMVLTDPSPIYAYVYEVGEDEGKTIHVIKIPVIRRAKPRHYDPLEDAEVISYERLDARLSALEVEWTGAFDDTQNMMNELITKVNSVVSGSASLSMGMYAVSTSFAENGTITETGDGWSRVTAFNDDGSITETYTITEDGEARVIKKVTTFNDDGSINSAIVE